MHAMERMNQLTAPARTYDSCTPTFGWTRGEFRIGMDCQIVCCETNRTLANSSGAHLWIANHANKRDKSRATRTTRPPTDDRPSAISDIALRKNIYR